MVYVMSTLEQILTPEEEEMDTSNPSISGGPDSNPIGDKYPSAFMIREGENELFRYYYNSSKMKTVILKGKDPFHP
jgi:hypothetical protein